MEQSGASSSVIQLATSNNRELPNNLQAEQNLLGAILLDNSITDDFSDLLLPDYFYDPVHGKIFEAAMRLIGRGQLANPVTLRAFFDGDPAFGDEEPDNAPEPPLFCFYGIEH